MKTKSNRGGKRDGSGQPKKYTHEMKNITLRAPECEHNELTDIERKIKEKYLVKKSENNENSQ